ncbi:MAG TPA: hypothetical protein VF800_00210 [Telluria sp.]|jgi:hypothetical protein
MPLLRLEAAPPLNDHIVLVPMDGWGMADRKEMLRTQGVADCLVMLMHCPSLRKGALAHMSWPHNAVHPGTTQDSLAIVRNTDRVRGTMVKHLKCMPSEIEVYLWRGYGFGPTASLPGHAGNIIDNLSWSNFALTIDMMSHGDFGRPGDTTPFAGCSAVSYVPDDNTAWFQ